MVVVAAVATATLTMVGGVAGATSARVGGPPSAPTSVTAVPGDESITVSWAAPTNLGGWPVLTYVAQAGKANCSTTGALTCTITGLTNGHKYNVKVRATNVTGKGQLSAPIVVIPGYPLAPTDVTAVAGNGTAVISWTAAVNNGSPITNYNVVASPGPRGCNTSGDTCTVYGLTNGTTYTFTVSATNHYGTGATGTSNPATPATLPGAPTAVTAGGEVVNGVPSAWVNFTAPASTGGSAITGYTVVVDDTTASTVTDYPAPTSAASTTGNPGAGYTVSGLNPTDTYTYAVFATNGVGNGPSSAAVGTLPVAPPTFGVTSNGDTTASATWTPSTVTFGTTVTGFALSTFDLTAGAVGPTGTATGGATSATISGLTIGDTYIACIRAQNSVGTGQSETCSEFTE